MVDLCEDIKRRWPCRPFGMNPMSFSVRIGISRDFLIKGKSMNDKDVELS